MGQVRRQPVVGEGEAVFSFVNRESSLGKGSGDASKVRDYCGLKWVPAASGVDDDLVVRQMGAVPAGVREEFHDDRS